MRNCRRTFAIIVSLMFSILIISGCSQNNNSFTAKECATVYYEVNIKHDITNVNKINLSENEGQASIQKEIKEAKASLRDTFEESQMKFTDAQLEDVCTALISAYKKTNVTIKELSNNGKKAEIQFESTYFDLSLLNENASNKTLDAIVASGLTDQNEIIEKFSEVYINNLIYEFQNAAINSDTKTKNIMFQKKGNIWVPEDENNFGIDLGKLVTNQQ